jgi:8-oxo-dGTP pyrophosphatase MutT (NUDIX family)
LVAPGDTPVVVPGAVDVVPLVIDDVVPLDPPAVPEVCPVCWVPWAEPVTLVAPFAADVPAAKAGAAAKASEHIPASNIV